MSRTPPTLPADTGSQPAKEHPTVLFGPRSVIDDTPTLQRMVLFYDQLHLLVPISRNVKEEAESPAMADLDYLREQGVALNVGPQIPPIGIGFSDGSKHSLRSLVAADVDAFIPFQLLDLAAPLYEGESNDDRRLRHIAQYVRPPASDFTTIALAAPPPIPDGTPASSQLLEIAIQGLALPPDDVPWQDLIQYRRSPGHVRELATLRSWMRKLARGGTSPAELKEELRGALDHYRREARAAHHRMVLGNLSVVLSLPAIAADPSLAAAIAATGVLIGLRAQRPDPVLEAAAPGREVAYLYNTERWLEKQRRSGQ